MRVAARRGLRRRRGVQRRLWRRRRLELVAHRRQAARQTAGRRAVRLGRRRVRARPGRSEPQRGPLDARAPVAKRRLRVRRARRARRGARSVRRAEVEPGHRRREHGRRHAALREAVPPRAVRAVRVRAGRAPERAPRLRGRRRERGKAPRRAPRGGDGGGRRARRDAGAARQQRVGRHAGGRPENHLLSGAVPGASRTGVRVRAPACVTGGALCDRP
mmetsp:Transcript_6032/g.24442  ORF Transcript_6032/g.24442 Transcript_6032/m.24442 type:complete len:218 (+) Transcript_6032:1929-2582(+)